MGSVWLDIHGYEQHRTMAPTPMMMINYRSPLKDPNLRHVSSEASESVIVLTKCFSETAYFSLLLPGGSHAHAPRVSSSTAECRIFVESHSCSVSSLATSGCSVHSDPVTFWCNKTEADHVISYTWSSTPSGISGSGMTNLVSLRNLASGTYAVKCTVACKRAWWTAASRTTYSIASLNVYDCTTTPLILSANENAGHVPTNYPAGCGTPEKVYIGFDHAKVKTRNLSRITTGNVDEDITEHCLGVVWEEGGEIDLFSLLDSNYLPYKDDLVFTTTDYSVNNGRLVYGENPKDLLPQICLITLYYEPSNIVCDRLWIVVSRPDSEQLFNRWRDRSISQDWTINLPQVYESLSFSTNSSQQVLLVDPEPGSPNLWGTPHPINSYLHHNARYEMRSGPVNGAGNQATYDTNGALITESIAAGTADIFAPYDATDNPRIGLSHMTQDVYPFIRALQLDGNPVRPKIKEFPTDLNRPCIFKGVNVESYISRRPIHPSGIQ